jgi:hypothetical protein
MVNTTNVPQPAFTALGFVPPTQAQILAGVIADFQAAFNNALNLSLANTSSLSTPQGQLASSETAIIAFTNALFCALANGVDPAYASGRMQDAIARIYGIERNPPQPTVAACLCVGLAGVVIPQFALAQDSAGNTYYAVDGGTIPSGGSITLNFANNITGPIPCPANTLTTIYQSVTGWDTINNPSDGVLGNVVESRAAFEARRQATVAGNSVGMLASVRGAVLNVPDVVDCFTTENETAYQGIANVQAVITGYIAAASTTMTASMGGHFATCITTGTTLTLGSVTNGYLSAGDLVSGTDGNTGYTLPAGCHIIAQLTGTPGGSAGATFLLNAPGTGGNLGSFTVTAISIVLDATVVTGVIQIGATIIGTSVPTSTTVVSQLTGTPGGVGTYQLSCTTQSIASESMTGGYAGLNVAAVTSGIIAPGQYISCPGIAYGTTIISGSGLLWSISASQTIGTISEPIEMTLGAVQLLPNSIYVAVAGGAEAAIAQAIWSKKAPGCNYNGNTSVVVYDTSPPYPPPGIPYTVTYETPTDETVFFAVTIANSTLVPANAATLIQNAIIAAFSGEDGGSRAQMSSTILASRYYCGIAALGSWAQITALTMGSTVTTAAVMATSSISGTTLTVGSLTSGTIAAGQQLVGAEVIPGTVIVSGSGSSWVVSIGQTVASTTIDAYAVTASSVTMLANQEPVTSAANIVVTV